MVDKRDPVDAAFIVGSKNRVDAPFTQQLRERFLTAHAAVHGKCHIVPDFRLPFLRLELPGVVSEPFLHPLIPETFVDKRGLDGCADRLAVVVRNGIDNARVGNAPVFPLDLFGFDVETGKQGAVLAECLETVGREDAFEDIGYLPFQVALRVVSFFQVNAELFILLVRVLL